MRTFLDFRAGTNRGMRKTLVTEPEHFFAYNNGITVTATSAETKEIDGQLVITSLENMQIVNGGQTTAAIYFSPREKGGIRSADQTHSYSDIDLSKVYLQMKLTVIDNKEAGESLKSSIATFANSQNSIQQSDLVSNHPFHLNIETRSRKQIMPPGANGLSSKWFYERARGQYSTHLRGLTAAQRRRFEAEYPKKQVFTKTDLAKYENTYRMKPFIVKKGAQANLKALGVEIIKEFEKDESAFGPAFYNDLVAKMILFRGVDTAILQAAWYKEERGLKAEIVTYSIALLRHKLRELREDIDLESIYRRQGISDKLLGKIVSLARLIREHITDFTFTDGVTNPSEFCKSEKGWRKIQAIDVDLSGLGQGDILTSAGASEAKKDRNHTNKISKSITGLELVMQVSQKEWVLIAEFNTERFPSNHRNVGIPRKCANFHTTGDLPSDKQMEYAKTIREAAYEAGFDFIDAG
ncbi:AIPR family protein [Mariniblastus sp.]|nr:AIPR family protein [Mariniblastus sp.]